MVHHVAVQDELSGEIEEAGAKGDAAAVRYDHRVKPDGIDRFTVHLDQLEWVDVNMEDMVVVLIEAGDGSFLNGIELNDLVDAGHIEEVAINEECELAPVSGGINLRRVA